MTKFQRILYRCKYVFACMMLIALITACGQKTNIEPVNGTAMKEFYSIEDFQSLVLSESTLKDLQRIAPAETISVTSYGGVCEYPTENGGKIQVKLHFQPDSEEWIVMAIEEEQ